jgi:hypothetical protein
VSLRILNGRVALAGAALAISKDVHRERPYLRRQAVPACSLWRVAEEGQVGTPYLRRQTVPARSCGAAEKG